MKPDKIIKLAKKILKKERAIELSLTRDGYSITVKKLENK